MRRLSQLIALLVFTGALACGGGHDSTSPTGPSITGTWTLQTVNGAPLPFTEIAHDTVKSEVLAASYEIKATSPSEGSFSYVETDRITVGASVVTFTGLPLNGTFTLNDTAVTFTASVFGGLPGGAGATYTGSWSGNTVTVGGTTGTLEVYARK